MVKKERLNLFFLINIFKYSKIIIITIYSIFIKYNRDWDFVTSVMNDTITDEYVDELETSPSSYGHFDDEIGL